MVHSHIHTEHLESLHHKAIASMVKDMLALPTSPATMSEYLNKHSAGNPFFVAEYLRTALDEELLWRDRSGSWQIGAPGEKEATIGDFEKLPMPTSIKDLIRSRLKLLTEPEHHVLEMAAIIGMETDVSLLISIVQCDENVFEEALQHLGRRQILLKKEPDIIFFHHAKIREVTYDNINRELKPELHHRAASTIETLPTNRKNKFLGILGHLWEQANEREKARSCHQEYARISAQKYEYDEAEKAYNSAIRLSEPNSVERMKASYELGNNVMFAQGLFDQTYQLLNDLVTCVMALEIPDTFASILTTLGAASQKIGEVDQSRSCFEQALRLAQQQGNRHLECRILISFADFQSGQGETSHALKNYDTALQLARKLGDSEKETDAICGIAAEYIELGRYDEARPFQLEALAIAREQNKHHDICSQLNNLAHIDIDKGLFPDALKKLTESYELSKKSGDRQSEANALGHLAVIATRQKDLDRAYEMYIQYHEITRITHDIEAEAAALNCMGNILIQREQLEEARKKFEESKVIAEKLRNPRLRSTVFHELGSIFHHQGKIEEAIAQFEECLVLSRQLGDKMDTGRSLSCLANIYRVEGEFDKAQPLFQEALSIARELHIPRGIIIILINYAALSLEKGEIDPIPAMYEEALDLTRQVNDTINEAKILGEWAGLTSLIEDEQERAEELICRAEHIFRDIRETTLLSQYLIEHGFIALAKGQSSVNLAAEAKKYLPTIPELPQALLRKKLDHLEKAQQAFDNKENHKLFRGRLRDCLPAGIKTYLDI